MRAVLLRNSLALVLLLFGSACATLPGQVPTGTDVRTPEAADSAATSGATLPTVIAVEPAFAFGDRWTSGGTGIELRRLNGPTAGSGVGVLVVRIDPASVTFRVVYDRDRPRTISTWAADYRALLAVNAGYFDELGQPVALLVSDGRLFSTSYADRGGMFAVHQDGHVEVRALSELPYNDEPLLQALQGWPLLVRAAGVAAYDSDDGDRSRRTAIGIDGNGRILIAVSPAADFSLAEWSRYLAAADLDLQRAVNLDGGSSTGLALRNENAAGAVEAFVLLPFALLVEAR